MTGDKFYESTGIQTHKLLITYQSCWVNSSFRYPSISFSPTLFTLFLIFPPSFHLLSSHIFASTSLYTLSSSCSSILSPLPLSIFLPCFPVAISVYFITSYWLLIQIGYFMKPNLRHKSRSSYLPTRENPITFNHLSLQVSVSRVTRWGEKRESICDSRYGRISIYFIVRVA